MKTIFNADRTKSAEIDYCDRFEPDYGFDDCLQSSCEVFLATRHLAGFFEIEDTEDSFARVNRAIDEARRVGDRVYFIELYKHSGYAVRIKPTYDPLCRFDSSLNGVIIVHAEAWKKHLSPIYTSAFVQREMDRIAKWAEAYLNGTVYEVNVFEDEVCVYSMGCFLTEEEALNEVQGEFPDLQFTEDDFNCQCIRTYSLKPEALARVQAA